MDNKQELRQKVLIYVKNVYDKEQRVPTIREISDNIDLRNEQLQLFEEYLQDILKSDLLTEEEHEKLLENEEY